MLLVTGKGGVGKSTVAHALALAAVGAGREAILCEIGPRACAPQVYGLPALTAGERCTPVPGLTCALIDPDDALREWLGRKVGRAAAALLTRSEALTGLVAAAPGARELTTIGKAWDLDRRPSRSCVVIDAPSTGHALALLRAPATFAGLAPLGPVGREARAVADSLRDPRQTTLVAVTAPTELAVAETLQLDTGLRPLLGRGPDLLVVDGVLERRFAPGDVATLRAAPRLPRTALRAALAHARRRSTEQSALAGLDGFDVPRRIDLPRLVRERLGPEDLRALARRMPAANYGRALARSADGTAARGREAARRG